MRKIYLIILICLLNTPVFASLDFDNSNDLVSMSSPAALDDIWSPNGMTVSCWIYPKSMGEGSIGVICAKRTDFGGNGNWVIRFLNTTTNGIEFGKDFGGTRLQVVTANNSISLNRWQHFVLTWDGSATAANVHIYINGIEVSYVTRTDGTLANNSDAAEDFIVGNRSVSLDSTWDGYIDQLCVFKRVISRKEINKLYLSRLKRIELSMDPQGDWAFDDCNSKNSCTSAGGIKDLTGRGSNGTGSGGSSGPLGYGSPLSYQ